MSTVSSEFFGRDPYYISRNRYHELRHFCLQYSEWEACYRKLESIGHLSSSSISSVVGEGLLEEGKFVDISIKKADCERNMLLVKECCRLASPKLKNYIFLAVTKNVSFEKLKAKYSIECDKLVFHRKIRRFYYILSNEKGM